MKTILLQGDSITDFYRDRNNDRNNQAWSCSGVGTGYANRLMGDIMYKYPGKYKVINLGIGGNKITDFYARIRQDCINVKPDYLTILLGVNDVWHEYDYDCGNDKDKYFKVYCMCIEEIKKALPNIKIYILEPFILESDVTRKNDGMIEKVKEIAIMARKVAEKYGLKFIELQKSFDELTKIAEPTYWLADGVHPTLAGHKMIAEKVLKVLEEDL